MTATVYLVGAPGVGKSTLMERLLAGWTRGPATRVPDYAPLVVEPHAREGWSEEPLLYLGKHRADFSGTDALSMGVLPAATAWAAEAPLPDLILGEGARLAHARFLSALATRGPVVLVQLMAPDRTLAVRRASRGSGQSEAWARGQATRVANLCAAVPPGVTLVQLWAVASPAALEGTARQALARAGIDLPPAPTVR